MCLQGDLNFFNKEHLSKLSFTTIKFCGSCLPSENEAELQHLSKNIYQSTEAAEVFDLNKVPYSMLGCTFIEILRTDRFSLA